MVTFELVAHDFAVVKHNVCTVRVGLVVGGLVDYRKSITDQPAYPAMLSTGRLRCFISSALTVRQPTPVRNSFILKNLQDVNS